MASVEMNFRASDIVLDAEFRDMQERLAKLDPRVTPEPRQWLARQARRFRRAQLRRLVRNMACLIAKRQIAENEAYLVQRMRRGRCIGRP